MEKPIDVRNKVETRAQLITKPKVTISYIKRYAKYLTVFLKGGYFSSDKNLTSDDESVNNESTTANANTEQYLSSEDETIGENLIIDETLQEHKHEHPMLCSCTQTESVSDKKYPGNIEIPNNENETNNETLPLTK